jgi:hypothetical protein
VCNYFYDVSTALITLSKVSPILNSPEALVIFEVLQDIVMSLEGQN